MSARKVSFWATLLILALVFANYDPVSKYAIKRYSHPPFLHSVSLPDGRKLAYAEYGNPAGKAVFVLQSFMQARIGHSPELEEINHRHNVRILVVDRPGYGESDKAPLGYTSLQFANDLEFLADNIGVKEFGLVGISAGGVYAMAALHEISSLKMRAVVLLSPAGPDPEQGYRDECIHPIIDPLRFVGYHLPFAVRIVMNILRWWVFFWYPELAFPPEQMYWAFSPNELHTFVSSGTWGSFCDATLEALKVGVDGILNDLAQISSNWPFQVKHINQDPINKHNIYIYHGTLDTIVPVGCAHHYFDSIPNATKLSICESCGHGMMGNITVWDDVLFHISQHF